MIEVEVQGIGVLENQIVDDIEMFKGKLLAYNEDVKKKSEKYSLVDIKGRDSVTS